MNLINVFVFFETPPKVKKEDPLKSPFKSLEARKKGDSRPKQKQDTTMYAILINKTNRHNSHVARVPASSSVKEAVRYNFGASILPNFITVYLYVKKDYLQTHKHMLSHIYQVRFSSRCSFSTFGVFLLLYLLLLEDEDPQNVRSGRRGEEKWLYSHGKTLVKFIKFHWQLEILHISCRFIELSTSDFDNILRLLLSVRFCTKSESLVKFIDQYYDLFFLLYASGRDSHAFRYVFRTGFWGELPEHLVLAAGSRQIRTFLFTSLEII